MWIVFNAIFNKLTQIPNFACRLGIIMVSSIKSIEILS